MNTTFWTSLIALVWLPLLSNAALGNGASPCDTTPCLNGATCYVPSGKATFFCTCSPNYTGTVCDQKITDSTDSLSDGEIAGIVVGCVVLLVLIVVIAIVIWKCCCKKSKSMPM
ncbi:delta-like protein 4 isoform X2 [Mytilus edulis]|uniref:delta-like protein 4 isoform X2 n=1 Tax=Mytilus edulis TaxID=6550 RepID=UPI0039EF15DD